jgi:hypothetical protein
MLLRQVHPNFLKDGHVLSIAFRPFPRDDGQLSVYDGDQIDPEPSWEHFTNKLQRNSAGVWGVTVEESVACVLVAKPMPLDDFPSHAVIDFSAHEKKVMDAKAKQLAAKADARGGLFVP